MKLEDAHQGEKVEGKKTTVNFMPNSTDVCSYNKHSGFLHNASACCDNQQTCTFQNEFNWSIQLNNKHESLKTKIKASFRTSTAIRGTNKTAKLSQTKHSETVLCLDAASDQKK